MRDLDAAVGAARDDGADAVVTFGLSMGGGAALRQAALGRHRPDAVVSLSAVSRWYVRDTRPMQRVHWLLETTPGRRLGARLLGLRLDAPWLVPPPPPLQVVSGIAPTPLLLVHGDRDEYFPLEHFRSLAQAAGPTATAWVVPALRTRREWRDHSARRADRTLGVCHDRPVSSEVPVQSVLPARGHHLPAAVLTVVAAGLLVGLPEVLGDLGRLAAVLVLQLGLVLSWVLVTGIQGFAGSLAVGAAAAVAADLILVLPERPSLGGLLAVFGVGFLAIVLQQMLRRPRHDLVASLSGGVLLFCVVGALGALLLLGTTPGGDGRAALAVAAVGTALFVGHLVDLVFPRPQLAFDVPRGVVGLVLAVLAAGAVTWYLRDMGDLAGDLAAAGFGAALGGVAALTAVAASYVVVEATAMDDDGEELGPHVSLWSLPVVQVVLPFAAAAPVALALQSVL